MLCAFFRLFFSAARGQNARPQSHKCNEVENAFPIFKVSRLVRVHTDSHNNGYNKMILLFPTCDR